MSTICLKVEAFAGTTIDDACRDLCALSDRVGILCEVQFNGVNVWAYPGTDPEQLVKAWQEQMKRPANAYKIASARPVGVPERQDAAWWSLVMGAAASIEDAANCLRDPAAKKQAEGAAKHYREAAQKLWDPAGVEGLPDFKGYSPDGPVGMALEWLSSALKSPAFQWDDDQREYAEKSLKDAEQWLGELMRTPGVPGNERRKPNE